MSLDAGSNPALTTNQNKSTMEKKCATCKRIVPVSRFFSNSNAKDGLFATCKDCCNARRRKKRPVTHPEGTKECFKCKQQKEFASFSVNKSKSDGYNHSCKQCEAAIRNKYKKAKEIDYARFYYPVEFH